MLRRDALKVLGAGAAYGTLYGCAAPLPAEPVVALPPDVQPFQLAPPAAPKLLPNPPGTVFFAPRAPAFPCFDDRDAVIRDAQGLSDAFERYIKAWFEGRVPAEIPRRFLPPGVNLSDYPAFRLVRPEDVTAEQQWAIRLARPITRAGYVGFFPDPNVSYLVVPAMFLPFGCSAVIEGEFPHARFFDIQVTPSFKPENYHYDGGVGVGEVPIVDADIEPEPGSSNPFRVGADRTAPRRAYRVRFEMSIGDPVALNPAFRPPYFRGKGNLRHGSGLMFQGAWGAAHSNGHSRGQWDTGQIWMRYYAPDRASGSLGGVPLPKIHYQLADGRRFFVQVDLNRYNARASRVVQLAETPPFEPTDKRLSSARYGWNKQTGIFRAIISGIAINTGWMGPEYVRALDKGVASRGTDLPGPPAYEQCATSATYVDYLTRGMELGARKVVVLTGKLPTHPTTLAGDTRMHAGEMRYWSIVGYAVPDGLDFVKAFDKNAVIGTAVHAIMDEDLLLDAERRYVVVLSRPNERPKNANAGNGVTWVDWGPSSQATWTFRWLTVGPEWTSSNAPTPEKLGRKGDWAEKDLDRSAIGNNSHDGLLGEYLPRIHYLAMEEFEKLGNALSADRIPPWR